jgi:hypothetical protein
MKSENMNKNIISDKTKETIVQLGSSSLRLASVLKINEELGIDNSITSTSVSKEKLSIIDNYLTQNLDNIQTVFHSIKHISLSIIGL